jgi:hypothetical protein
MLSTTFLFSVDIGFSSYEKLILEKIDSFIKPVHLCIHAILIMFFPGCQIMKKTYQILNRKLDFMEQNAAHSIKIELTAFQNSPQFH